jgi:hypothetical protein
MSRRPNWSPTASILFSRTAHLPARVVHLGTSHVSLEGMGVDLRRGPGLTARETSSSAAAGYEISKVKYDKGLYAQCKQTTSTGSSDTADYQMAGRPREEIDYF